MELQLSEAIPRYLSQREAAGYKPNTVRNQRRALNYFLQVVGDLQMGEISEEDCAEFFEHRSAFDSAATLNNHRAALKTFFEWARATQLMAAGADPLYGFRRRPVMPSARLRIPAAKFEDVLDAAEDPKDRIIIALGLYLFLRGSEVMELRISDIDIKNQEIHVRIPKTNKFDIMPICTELDEELRAWLGYYQSKVGIMRKTYYLVPKASALFGAPITYHPDQPHPQAYRNVSRVLEVAGYAMFDHNGESLREGQHTLRRSGARALFDKRLAEGYDGALRQVQAMLHHSTGAQTEKYLGIDIDMHTRNKALKGQSMFRSLPEADRQAVRLEVVA